LKLFAFGLYSLSALGFLLWPAYGLPLTAYSWCPLAAWGMKLFAFGLYSLSALGFLLWPAYSLPLIAGIRLQLEA
jgi:hypothetical protein